MGVFRAIWAASSDRAIRIALVYTFFLSSVLIFGILWEFELGGGLNSPWRIYIEVLSASIIGLLWLLPPVASSAFIVPGDLAGAVAFTLSLALFMLAISAPQIVVLSLGIGGITVIGTASAWTTALISSLAFSILGAALGSFSHWIYPIAGFFTFGHLLVEGRARGALRTLSPIADLTRFSPTRLVNLGIMVSLVLLSLTVLRISKVHMERRHRGIRR